MGACSGQRKMQLTSADRRFWRGVVRRSITLRGARDCHFCIARLLDATRLSGVARVPSGPRRWLTRQPRPGCATPSVEEVDSPVHSSSRGNHFRQCERAGVQRLADDRALGTIGD